MYIKRDITEDVLKGAQESSVLTITGPRQSGKSTLCRHLFPKHNYIDMQDIDNLNFAKTDPKGFLRAKTNEYGIIIDEAQYAPNLFSQIKVLVDQERYAGKEGCGRYILSGSQNFLLNQQISESLSGRVYIYNLLPLSISELSQSNLLCKDYYEQINKGFYPGLYDNKDLISKFYESYLLTYVERDLRFLKNIENIALFKKFLYLCATRIGQTITLTGLASDTGISSQTAKSWLSILEASFIIYNLPSYHNNLAKRSTKSSKLYFYDVGLASHIMGVNSQYIKDKREILEQLFENMIILDCLKQNINISYGYKLYFWRDSNLKEVDLILEKGLDVLPVEIKSSETINNKFFKNIFWFRDQLKIENKPALIYAGEENQPRTNVNVYRWKNCYFLFDNNQKK